MLFIEDPAQAALFWMVRKAGLSLLTGMAGDAKPATVIEDAAVKPAKLPAYLAGLSGILGRDGLEAWRSGAPGFGFLPLRPILDLSNPAGGESFPPAFG